MNALTPAISIKRCFERLEALIVDAGLRADDRVQILNQLDSAHHDTRLALRTRELETTQPTKEP